MLVTHTPLLDRVLVKPIPPASEILGGLTLPEAAARSLNGLPTGTVIAVGPGIRRDDGQCYAPEVAPGDVVLYSPAPHTEVQHNGEKHLLMREPDVFSIVTKAKDRVAVTA